jgi:hypothetical protein
MMPMTKANKRSWRVRTGLQVPEVPRVAMVPAVLVPRVLGAGGA